MKLQKNNVESQGNEIPVIQQKKYVPAYFGIATGVFLVLIFSLIITNMVVSDSYYIFYIKPYIPFFNSLTFINVLGGIAVSFIWGFVLGYFFILVYQWFEKKLLTRA